MIEEKQSACPKNFNQTRFIQNCLTVLKEIKPTDLGKYTPESIALTMIKGAFLGLDFFNRECYAIPFGNELQFLTDYKGDIKLARQYSIKPIKDIYAELVREGDQFEYKVINGQQSVNFNPIQFSDTPVIGAFAIVYYEDGAINCARMSVKELIETKKNWSKCPNSPAWVKATGEMYKKTVLKRLCKMIELNFDNADQAQAYEEGSDLKRDVIDVSSPSPEVRDPFEKTPQDRPKQGQEAPEAPETAQADHEPSEDEEQAILKVQGEIEKFLITKHQQPSLVYKYSKDEYKRPLTALNLREILALKDKIKADFA